MSAPSERLSGQQAVAEKQPARKISRAENPLLQPVILEHSRIRNFEDTVNAVINTYGGPTIAMHQEIELDQSFVVISMQAPSCPDRNLAGLRQIVRSAYNAPAIAEGLTFNPDLGKPQLWNRRGKNTAYALVPHRSVPDPRMMDGILLKAVDPAHPDPTQTRKDVALDIRQHQSPSQFSEVESAYMAVLTSLTLGSHIDISTPDKFHNSLNLRQEIFMQLYHSMLAEMVPMPPQTGIVGLETQFKDIDRNLYEPLITKRGKAMNTLMVGAQGTGKSLAVQEIAFRKDAVTALISIESFGKVHAIVNKLQHIEGLVGLPGLIIVNDGEAIVGQGGFAEDASGNTIGQNVNTLSRSQLLSVMERMEDTHGIPIGITLNHAPTDAAMIRRFNLVYFPLPDEDIRRTMLAQIMPQATLTDHHYEALLDHLAANTGGFNFHGLQLIVDYTDNAMRSMIFEAAVKEGLAKAKQRTPVEKLMQADNSAKLLVQGRPTIT